jgi:hypothetical protein
MMTSKIDFVTTVIEALNYPFYVIDSETVEPRTSTKSMDNLTSVPPGYS